MIEEDVLVCVACGVVAGASIVDYPDDIEHKDDNESANCKMSTHTVEEENKRHIDHLLKLADQYEKSTQRPELLRKKQIERGLKMVQQYFQQKNIQPVVGFIEQFQTYLEQYQQYMPASAKKEHIPFAACLLAAWYRCESMSAPIWIDKLAYYGTADDFRCSPYDGVK